MVGKNGSGPSAALMKARERFEQGFNKSFGEGSLQRYEDRKPYEVISTGSLDFDVATGIGGLVEGRLHEWWGDNGVGKTSLALCTVASAQRKYPAKMCAWVDVEQTFDWDWAVANGVNPSQLYLFSPSNAEDVADAVKRLVSDGEVMSLVVLDSIGAMIPRKEMEKDADQVVVAQKAKIVTRMVTMAVNECAHQGTTLLMINQVRANLSYGAETTTGGGFSLKHITTTKAKFRKTATPPLTVGTGDDKLEVGHEVAVLMERNKVALPRRRASFVLLRKATKEYGPIGVDQADETFKLGVDYGIISRDGSWFTLPVTGERFQGQTKVLAALRSHPEVLDYIREQVLAVAYAPLDEEPEPEVADEDLIEVIPAETKKPRLRKASDIEPIDDGISYADGIPQ
jgi:recombination protein RecA